MARFRTIDPAMRTSPQIDELSVLARLVLVYLLSEADDEGRLLGDAISLRLACFPRGFPRGVTPARLDEAVRELTEPRRRLFTAYEVDGQAYLAAVGWRDGKSWMYQVVDRPKSSRFPDPPDGTCPNRPSGRGRRADARGQAEIDDSSSKDRRAVAGDVDVDEDGTRTKDEDSDRTRKRARKPKPSPGTGSGLRGAHGEGSNGTPSTNGAANGNGPGKLAASLAGIAVGLRKSDERVPLIRRLLDLPGSARDEAWCIEAKALIDAARARQPA
jgi:hypothetical protein